MRLLIIDDDERLRSSVQRLFQDAGWSVEGVNNYLAAEEAVPMADVVLSDWDLGFCDTKNGAEIVTGLREVNPEARYIIWSGLDRIVPEWCEFYLKSSITEIIDAVGQP